MTLYRTLSAATAISALLGSTAIADVTSEQIWGDMKGIYEELGYKIDVGSESQDGETLNVNDVTMSMAVEEGQVVISGVSFAFEQLSDGTVSISVPEEMPLTAEFDNVVINLLMTITDMNVIASGDENAAKFDFSASNYGISLVDVKQGDVTFSPTVSATVNDMSGFYATEGGDLSKMEGDFAAKSMDIIADVKNPEGGGQLVKATVKLMGLSETFNYSIPTDVDYNDMPAALAAGLGGEVSASHSGVDFDIVVTDETEGFDLKGSSGSGALKYALSQDGIGATWGSTNTQVTVIPAQLPLPISIGIEETSNEIRFPVSKSDTPDDARLKFKIAGLSVDEALWGMVDPSAALPRDPATLIVDLTSKLNLDFDLFNVEAAEDMMGDEFPGKLHSLDINALQLSAVGAEFTGTGGFTFNNDDLTTFDGVPAPTGSLELKLVGGNGLLDKLVQMGLIPEEQAMGARMMTGMFANAGEGEDELVSKIEVKEDGSVHANGQRLK